MPPKRKAPTAKSKVTTASTSRSNTNSTAGPSGTSSPPLRKRARKRPLGDDGLITSSTDWADVVAASLLDTSSASVRRAPFKTRPTLLSAAIRVFAANFKTLGNKGGDLQLTRLIDRLKIVPPHLMDKLWRRLLIHCPEVFSIHIISEIIGSLSDIYLPGDVINAVSNMQSFSQLHLNKERITKFELTGNSKLTDDQVAKYVAGLPMVEEVILRDITQVKNKTASVIASFGPQIKVVNLSGTSVTAQEVVEIILSCPNIQVLKLAHCKALIQPTKLNKEAWKTLGDQFEDDMLEDEGVPLAKLKTLKLKQPSQMPIRLSEGTKISQWYPLQPLWFSISSNLENLDISGFSGDLGHLPFARACPPHRLRKMLMPDVVLHANHLPPLLDPSAETLEVFACRVLPNGSMFDEEGSIFDLLFKCEKLQKLSIEILPSSYPTGKAEALSSILMLLQRVGVKELNLRNSSFVLPAVLEVRDDILNHLRADLTPAIETLDLSNAHIDDELIKLFTICKNLESLNLSGTRVNESTVHAFVDACPYLHRLDLTSCRGIPVGQRRNFFKYHEEWKREQDSPEKAFPSCLTTLRYTPDVLTTTMDENNFPLLDRHLRRLEDAYAYLYNQALQNGINYDGSGWPGARTVKTKLWEAVKAKRQGDWRVRILAHASGKVDVEVFPMPEGSPPFRQSLSLPAMERRGKVVMLDPQSSMVADSSEAALYNWKTVKRNHYDEALARTKSEAESKDTLAVPFDSLIHFRNPLTSEEIITELTTSNIAIHAPTSDSENSPEWVTPAYNSATPFLRGVMRQELLERGQLREEVITVTQWRQWVQEGRHMVGLNGLRGVWDIDPIVS